MSIKNWHGRILGWIKKRTLEVGHRRILPLKESEVSNYKRESAVCSPNSVFKLEMLMIPEIQDQLIEILSIMPLAKNQNEILLPQNGMSANPHNRNAEQIRNEIINKLEKYGFEDFINKINDTVLHKCRRHNGELIVMNKHSYVKMMEVIYTAYITDIQPSDIVMNLSCGNTYWCNVWLANKCKKLYANDNGFYIAIHDADKQVYNYNEYQQGINKKIEFSEFDASKRFAYEDNMFDKIVSHSSIEHIDNWDANVLPEIIRVLKPGGKCGLASVYHPLWRENFGKGQSSWWTNKKWKRFVGLQRELDFKIIGNSNFNYGMPWRREEDTDDYRFGGSIYIVNFIFFQKNITTLANNVAK